MVDEVDRIVGLSGLLEEGIGQVKQRDRGVTGAQTLVATRASGSEPPPDPGRFSPGWVHHYNHHRPRTACGNQPPASRLHATADNVMTNYS